MRGGRYCRAGRAFAAYLARHLEFSDDREPGVSFCILATSEKITKLTKHVFGDNQPQFDELTSHAASIVVGQFTGLCEAHAMSLLRAEGLDNE